MKKLVKAYQWVSVKEMKDIQADTKLVSRLKAGSKVANKKNGRQTVRMSGTRRNKNKKLSLRISSNEDKLKRLRALRG